ALTVSTSIFSNPDGGNLGLETLAPGFKLVSLGHNLLSDVPGVPLDPTDLTDTDPRLGPLADNGGPTFTHALLFGSPAIDAGRPVRGVTTDQRGVPRPQGNAPDIGAFESPFAHNRILVTSLADSGPGTLRAAITQADMDNPETTLDTITFAPSVRGTITLLSALPDLSHTLTIDGPGPSALTVARSFDANDFFRIFTVPAGADVTISGLTISGGDLVGDGDGGGIYNAGTLTVTHCNVSDNLIDYGGAGGGIYNSAGS